jgi:hypothetical protein
MLELVLSAASATLAAKISEAIFPEASRNISSSGKVTRGIVPTQDEVRGEAKRKIQRENTDG